MAVIRDVAKKAGVAISTVSKYLNKPEELTEEYRIRVGNAIKELNYKPNLLARSMRTNKTNFIALIVPDMENAFYSEIYNSVRIAAYKTEYTPILYTTDENLDLLNAYIDNVSGQHADGLILCFLDEDEIMDRFEEVQHRIPITLLSWDLENTKFNSIIIHLFDLIYQATRHIINAGKKRIAYLNGPDGSRISKEKYSGFETAMQEAGLDIREEYLDSGKYRFQTGYKTAMRFMQLPEKPEAIVCANDVLAIGCVKYLTHNGYRVPEDVAVIGIDGIQLGNLYDPSISTVAMPIPEIGEAVVDMLINKIEKPGSRNRQIVFNSKLIVRRSTNENAPIVLDL